VTMLTVHKMLILPKPQHPSIQTGSGFLVGTLWTRWTVVSVDCCEYWCWVVPACACRPVRHNAFRSVTCWPRIPFIVVRNPQRLYSAVCRAMFDDTPRSVLLQLILLLLALDAMMLPA